MEKSEFVEMLVYAENERDLLFLENAELKGRIAALEKRISEMEDVQSGKISNSH